MFLGLSEIIPSKSEHIVKLQEEACNKIYNYNKIIGQVSKHQMIIKKELVKGG